MPSVPDAIYALLAADTQLVTMLGQLYRSKPKLFASAPVPLDVGDQFVVIGGVIGGEETSDLSGTIRIRAQQRGILLYWPETGSTVDVDAAAERIRRLLHRCTLDLAPDRFKRCLAGEPEGRASDTDTYARVVPVSVVFQEA